MQYNPYPVRECQGPAARDVISPAAACHVVSPGNNYIAH